MKRKLNTRDIAHLRAMSMGAEDVEKQLNLFKQGSRYRELVRPATVDDGIIRLTQRDIDQCTQMYESRHDLDVWKFVPASGAASRMFKDLSYLYRHYDVLDQRVLNRLESAGRTQAASLKQVVSGLAGGGFAFQGALQTVMEQAGESLSQTLKGQQYHRLLHYLLTPAGLNLANLPKALIPFHQYKEGSRTPLAEHVAEGLAYARKQGRVHLMFTVLAAHKEMINSYAHKAAKRLCPADAACHIHLSCQSPATSTVALTTDNSLARDAKGELILRPGGHGALLGNLNAIDADIIFIKNIDNVTFAASNGPLIGYKKALAGYLLQVQKQVFAALTLLKKRNSTSAMDRAVSLVRDFACFSDLATLTGSSEDRRQQLIKQLQRPIRVCGVVPNQDEPGGGPFWVRGPGGLESLQIVEKAEINTQDEQQRSILQQASHFNPVDLVCAVRDMQGRKYDLRNYCDNSAYMITRKFAAGVPLLALEWPGLWNGAMAGWNTLFVEVPLDTFHPVKEVTDLLRPGHCGPSQGTRSMETIT